eukprot:358891-Chlamydomonas_euryale.AAC.1
MTCSNTIKKIQYDSCMWCRGIQNPKHHGSGYGRAALVSPRAQAPADLEGAVSSRLASLVQPAPEGGVPRIDLDALLLLLVGEFHAGNCPRSPMLFPRRLTDGALFNIFNAAGHTPYADAFLRPANAGRRPPPLPSPQEQPRASGAWQEQVALSHKLTDQHTRVVAGRNPTASL